MTGVKDILPIERALAEFFEREGFRPVCARGEYYIGVASCHVVDSGENCRVLVDGDHATKIVCISELARQLLEAGRADA